MKKSLIYLITVLLIFTSCKNNKNERFSTDLVNNPNTAQGNVKSDKLPVFQFETDMHDFGKVIEGEKLTYSFKFKNVGKSDLIIASANATCGCTVADFPRTPIAPGSQGLITVTFNTSGKMGFQHKTVTLVANTQPNDYSLIIKAMVNNPENK